MKIDLTRTKIHGCTLHTAHCTIALAEDLRKKVAEAALVENVKSREHHVSRDKVISRKKGGGRLLDLGPAFLATGRLTVNGHNEISAPPPR